MSMILRTCAGEGCTEIVPYDFKYCRTCSEKELAKQRRTSNIYAIRCRSCHKRCDGGAELPHMPHLCPECMEEAWNNQKAYLYEKNDFTPVAVIPDVVGNLWMDQLYPNKQLTNKWAVPVFEMNPRTHEWQWLSYCDFSYVLFTRKEKLEGSVLPT